MHALLHILVQAGTTAPTTGKSTKSSGSSVFPLIVLVLVIGAVYFLFMRPRQQRMKQQQAARTQLEVGDLVLTAGGIQGTLVALDQDMAEVEVAPGVVLTMLRRAISPHPGGRPADEAEAAAKPVDDEWELPSRAEDDHLAADGPAEPGGPVDDNGSDGGNAEPGRPQAGGD